MRLSPLVVALTAAASTSAYAADPSLVRGIDPVGSKPATTQDAYLVTEGARTAPAHSATLALDLDFATGLMALKNGDARIGDLIARRLDLHLLGGYAATDWLELGADVPLTVWQRDGLGTLRDATGFDAGPASSAGFGDIRALAKVRLLAEERGPVGLAFVGEVRLPTGAAQSFMGERGVVLVPRAVVERAFLEDLRIAFELGYRYRPRPGRFLNLYVGDEVTAALAAAYRVPGTGARPVTAFGELLLATPARAPLTSSYSDAFKTSIELMLGARVGLGGNFVGQIGAGTGIAGQSGFGREGLRASLAVRYERVFHDRDGDGIADEDDLCPDVPEDRDGFEDSDGCPDPDNDKDGIPDVKDRCPDEPGPEEYEGCPDRDGDDVPDPADKCPDQAGPASNDGCPVGRPYAIVEHGALVLRGAVNFDSGKATLKRGSNEVLDDVANALAGAPAIKHVRVEGHTDNVGGEALNLELSKRRAHTVVEYLVAKGIAAERLDSQGYGLSRPIADNGTALGRAKNRRVEFAVDR